MAYDRYNIGEKFVIFSNHSYDLHIKMYNNAPFKRITKLTYCNLVHHNNKFFIALEQLHYLLLHHKSYYEVDK